MGTMTNRRRLLLGASALIAAAAAGGLTRDARASERDGVVAWIRRHAIPLATVEPGSTFDDLEPLRAMLAKARVVSLGEATHGTREFFQLKHRLIEYCVSRLGFTIIAFE